MKTYEDAIMSTIWDFTATVTDCIETDYCGETPTVFKEKDYTSYNQCITCLASNCGYTEEIYESLENDCIKEFLTNHKLSDLDYNNLDLMDDYYNFEREYMWDGLDAAFISTELIEYIDCIKAFIEISIGNYGQYIPFKKEITFYKGENFDLFHDEIVKIAESV